MNTILILVFCGVVASTCHASNLQDFCIADLKGPDSPSGYQCLPSDTVTSQNFKHSFTEPFTIPFRAKLYPATVKEFPVLNVLAFLHFVESWKEMDLFQCTQIQPLK